MTTVIETSTTLPIQHDNRVGLDDLEREIQRSLASPHERIREERNEIAKPVETKLNEPSRVGLDELAAAIEAARYGRDRTS